MKIPQITIQTTSAKLEMENAIPKPILEIHQQQPQVILEISHPQIQLDTTESRAAMGYENPTNFGKNIAEKGRQTALEYIEKVAQQGDLLARIETKQDGFAELAHQEAAFQEPLELTIRTLPKPDISLQRGQVKISSKPMPEEAVKINYTPSKVQAQYIPYNIQIDVKI